MVPFKKHINKLSWSAEVGKYLPNIMSNIRLGRTFAAIDIFKGIKNPAIQSDLEKALAKASVPATQKNLIRGFLNKIKNEAILSL